MFCAKLLTLCVLFRRTGRSKQNEPKGNHVNRRRKGVVKHRTKAQNSDKWLTHVADPIRSQVIHDFLRQRKQAYVEAFRQQEVSHQVCCRNL